MLCADRSALTDRHRGRVQCAVWAVRLGLVAGVAAASAGCAKARAETVPDGPPLQVPAPPPRVLAPLEEPPPVAEVVPAPAPVAQAPPVVPPEPRPVQARPAAVPAAVTAAPEETVEARQLRTGASAGPATERGVRDLLARANRDLSLVAYDRLSADGRVQHEQSRRFARQAEQALSDRNFVFAATLAEKAAALAAELLGR